MRSDYYKNTELMHVLACLTPPNRLAMELSLATGLRISDVLNIKASQVLSANRRITVRELKTGKSRRLTIPLELYNRMIDIKGLVYVFEHRLNCYKHRTRQAVNKDLKRACLAFRIPKNIIVSPHTARKNYAVNLAKNKGFEVVQKNFNHTDASVTAIYAMADILTARKLKKR